MDYIVGLVFSSPEGEIGWTWARTDEEADETVRVYLERGYSLKDRYYTSK